ncbi:hypothetical protein HHI36_006134 [Cryptolaemus montrouzieri]|uniref:Uncharacterized protein n=1 Tax=Cryptolaemus montrouzieri TaxID=559131 RepID=A0ABD2NW57_9CUCU
MGVNLAARVLNIPSRIVLCRLQNNDPSKKAMGPTGIFGEASELKWVAHIEAQQKRAFAPTRDDIRCLAFDFANKSSIGTVPQPSGPQNLPNNVTETMAEHIPDPRPTTPDSQTGPSSAHDLPLSGGKTLNVISPLPIIPVGLKKRGRSITTILKSP